MAGRHGLQDQGRLDASSSRFTTRPMARKASIVPCPAPGLKFRDTPPKYQAFSTSAMQPSLNIPPGDPNYEARATFTVPEDITLLDLTPHMHLRGKAFKYTITYPDGRKSEELA